MRLKLQAVAALFVTVAGVRDLASQTYPASIDRLRGLPPVEVNVVIGGDSVEHIDLSSVKVAVELKLRQNGLRVIMPGDSVTFPRAYLYFVADLMLTTDHTQLAYRADFYVDEVAKLIRAPIYSMGRTWWATRALGILGVRRDLAADLKNLASDKTDEFLNSYLAANPRR